MRRAAVGVGVVLVVVAGFVVSVWKWGDDSYGPKVA